jgi:protein-tyrosine phosphatase
MGNICRSPTALGVMRHLLAEKGLADVVEVDSAGTGGWHVGEPPDPRATAAARARGITLDGAARQIDPADFDEFDLILAADRANLADLRAIAPPGTEHKVRLLREFDPASVGAPDLDVPDPYYGGHHGFDAVLDLVEAACRGLLAEIRPPRESRPPRAIRPPRTT